MTGLMAITTTTIATTPVKTGLMNTILITLVTRDAIHPIIAAAVTATTTITILPITTATTVETVLTTKQIILLLTAHTEEAAAVRTTGIMKVIPVTEILQDTPIKTYALTKTE